MTTDRALRAPKPWYRARNIVLVAVLAVVGWVGLQVYRALTAEPGRAVNYARLANELVASAQPADVRPDSPNALDVLGPAFDAVTQVNAVFRTRNSTPVILDYSIIYSPSDYVWYEEKDRTQMLADALEAIGMLKEQGAFESMAAASATPFALRPTPDAAPLVEVLLPDLGKTRQLARANAGRMFLATRAGDGAELARAYEDSLAMGRIWTYQTVIIEHLVGYAITSLANTELIRACMEREWDEATLRACMDALDRQQRWMGRLDLAIEGERLMALDTIQWSHTDDGRGNGRLILTAIAPFALLYGNPGSGVGGGWMDRLMEYRIGNIAGIAFASKKASVRKANEYYDGLVEYVRATPDERQAMAFQPDAAAEALPRRYLLVRTMLPAANKSMQSFLIHEVRLAGARLVLAIEIYRARHGAYPGTLADLVPGILPLLPQDPLSAAPYCYRVLEPGEDPDGRRYLLYSAGHDGRDDGGKFRPIDPAMAMQQAGAGFDYPINEPRERVPGDEKAVAAPGG